MEFEIDGTDLAAYWRRAMDKGSLVDQTRVVRCIRTHFKLTDDTEKLLGVFECCKGETPDDSGDMFVFSNHLCFRKDAAATTARGSYGASDTAPSKFAVPMPSILDARVNPGVYPFGAIVVTIDGLWKPWIFSFFTERETAVKCVRSARGYRGGGRSGGAMAITRGREFNRPHERAFENFRRFLRLAQERWKRNRGEGNAGRAGAAPFWCVRVAGQLAQRIRGGGVAHSGRVRRRAAGRRRLGARRAGGETRRQPWRREALAFNKASRQSPCATNQALCKAAVLASQAPGAVCQKATRVC